MKLSRILFFLLLFGASTSFCQEDIYKRSNRLLEAAKNHTLNESIVNGDTLALNYALYHACLDSTSSPELVKTLINHGADIRYQACSDPGILKSFLFGFTKLLLGAIVPGLAKAKMGQDCESLLEAAWDQNNFPVVKLLVEGGLYSDRIMVRALEKGHYDIFRIMFRDGKLDSWAMRDCITAAAYRGDSAMVVELVNDPRNSHYVDKELLIGITKKNDLPVIRALFENEHKKSTIFFLKSNYGDLLRACAATGNVQMMQYFVSFDLLPNEWTITHCVQDNDSAEMIRYVTELVGSEVCIASDLLESCHDPEMTGYLRSKGALTNDERIAAFANGWKFYEIYADSCSTGYRSYDKAKRDALLRSFEGKKVLFQGDRYDSFSWRGRVMKEAIDRNDAKTLKWLLENTNVVIYNAGSGEWIYDKFYQIIIWENYRRMASLIPIMIDSEKDKEKQKLIVQHCMQYMKDYHALRCARFRKLLKKKYSFAFNGE
ncbi:MAG: hypothetical protein ACJ77K_08225 [Bacteroidia bacterium]